MASVTRDLQKGNSHPWPVGPGSSFWKDMKRRERSSAFRHGQELRPSLDPAEGLSHPDADSYPCQVFPAKDFPLSLSPNPLQDTARLASLVSYRSEVGTGVQTGHVTWSTSELPAWGVGRRVHAVGPQIQHKNPSSASSRCCCFLLRSQTHNTHMHEGVLGQPGLKQCKFILLLF